MSKRIWHHPEVPADETTVAWRSAGQLEDSPAFRQWLDREFPQGAAEMADEAEAETARRSFLKLMGASTALAGFGMAACRRPESYIMPYTKAPEWVIPGKATYYATSMPRPHGATPLVVTTFEGRPTKLAPNALHPDAEGTDAFAQASILDLYSPSRSHVILNSGKPASREALDQVIATVAKNPSAKIGFVFGLDESPTRTRLIKSLGSKFASAKFYQYEALASTAPKAIGQAVKLVPDFSKADVILSLDCDFVGTDLQGPVTAFFDRRKPEGKGYESKPEVEKMNRLYAVEAAFSLTGGMADHRLRVAPSQLMVVAAQIARELGVSLPAIDAVPAPQNATELEWIKQMALDLKAHAGKSAVLAGSRQEPIIHQIAFAINRSLQNIGDQKPVLALETELKGYGDLATLKADVDAGNVEMLFLLTPGNPVYDAPNDIRFSEVLSKLKLSIHLGDRSHATAHASTWHIPAAHYLESWSDARSSRGTYTVVQPMILPLYDQCVSEIELLVALASNDGKLLNGEGAKGAASPAYTAVRETFSGMASSSQEAWKELLRSGFLPHSSYKSASVTLPNIAAPTVAKAPTPDSLELVFATDSSVFDGRWIDNAWLQEAPDPISKLTWDNAALIAPKTAKALDIYDKIITPEPVSKVLGIDGKYADVGPDGEGENRFSRMIKVEINGRSLELPVLISFGQAENTIVIPLGYGQAIDKDDELKRQPANETHVGLVGVNRGFNAYPLRDASTSYVAPGAKVSLIDRRYSVALTQEHSAMYGRALAREISTVKSEHDHKGDFSEQLANVKFQGNDSHAPKNIYLYKPEDKNGKPLLSDTLHQWTMSIDLSSCMGCNACLVACQSENNIPVVGKEQVAKGREMHWIRMDRYFATQEFALDSHGNRVKESDGSYKLNPEWIRDNPAMVPQPVACVHCESAPCEVVCPVNATVHTEDGLNAMAYNRCIGTRYCANNCPYKARRFNFFDYNKRNPLIKHNLYKGPFGTKAEGDPEHLQKNPNVTVRMRGVMEKCTYCVQRLKDAVIRQKRGQKQESLVAGKLSSDMQVSTQTLRIPVDSVKVACQEACPANAISFGNKLDEEKSVVGRSKTIERNYDLLNYIGTRPRTSYLARVKNPNPSMPDAPFIGKATIHMA